MWLILRDHKFPIDAVVIKLAAYGAILGVPWLNKVAPVLNWKTYNLDIDGDVIKAKCQPRDVIGEPEEELDVAIDPWDAPEPYKENKWGDEDDLKFEGKNESKEQSEERGWEEATELEVNNSSALYPKEHGLNAIESDGKLLSESKEPLTESDDFDDSEMDEDEQQQPERLDAKCNQLIQLETLYRGVRDSGLKEQLRVV